MPRYPTDKFIETSYIIRNLRSLVDDSNTYALNHPAFNKPFINYNIHMQERSRLLGSNEKSYDRLLKDSRFCKELRDILRDFGMNQRGSALTSHEQFRTTLAEASDDFHLLGSAQPLLLLQTLNLNQKIGDEIVGSIIKRIYELFDCTNRLSSSGGVVIASKTMHMIMPRIFAMIDGRVMKALHDIPTCDYRPHQDDGNWYEALPEYNGRKLNPYPTTGNWSSYECYAAGLMYYKRIILEWCQENNTDIHNFLDVDRHRGPPSRIVDKIFWYIGGLIR